MTPFLSAHARHDFDEIQLYLQLLAQRPAERIRQSLLTALRAIRSYPLRGRIEGDLSRDFGEEMRSALVSGYRIFYLVAEGEAQVVGIVHAARDYEAILRRRVQ